MLVKVPRTAVARRGFAPHLRLTRTLATSSRSDQNFEPSQSPKIHCGGFRLFPPEALHKLHIGALMASGKPINLIYGSLLHTFGRGVATIAREFGYDSGLEQKGEMKAVFWPGWRVDAALEGKVKVLTGDKDNKRMEVDMFWTTPGAYVPGNAFAPLSYLSQVSPLEDILHMYTPEFDLEQLGEWDMKITTIPFTVSPLGLAKHLRKIVGKRNNWDDYIADEAQWKEVMLACYPILFPMYIAEFTYDDPEDGKRTFPVVVEAHSNMKHEIQTSFPPPPQLVQRGRFDKSFFWNPIPFVTNTTIASSPMPVSNSFQKSDLAKPFVIFNSYMTPAPDPSLGTIPPSPMLAVQEEEEPEGINWDDPRIQEWSDEGRLENSKWLTMKASHEASQRSTELLRKAVSGGDAWMHLAETLKQRSKAVEEAKPTWLKLWDEARRAIKTTTKNGKK